MHVLLIGKGARENALAWKIKQSKLLTNLSLWPGSAVMGAFGTPLDLRADAAPERVADAAKHAHVDLVVCGPEAPLAEGLADALAARGIPTFGPKRQGAMLEASKAFSKEMMRKAGVPTAAFKVVKGEDECRAAALEALQKKGGVVLKASGLAAGKGVFVCFSQAEVENGLRHLYHTDMKKAAEAVVVEDVLKGRECSYFTFLGQDGATGLGFAVDYKRLNDGDQGPNTGGMGCYAPVAWLPPDAEALVVNQVVEPMLKTLRAEGIDYCGCLYVGLMWTADGPSVVEFNVRLGDPEAQVLSVYDDRDWLAQMAAKAGITVPADQLAKARAPITHGERAVAVVMASRGYPYGENEAQPAPLPDHLFKSDDARQQVYAASMSGSTGQLKTGSGRVLTVVARGPSFKAARERAYKRVQEISAHWDGFRWRKDVGLAPETEETANGARK